MNLFSVLLRLISAFLYFFVEFEPSNQVFLNQIILQYFWWSAYEIIHLYFSASTFQNSQL